MKRKQFLFILASIVLVASSLRSPTSSIGPVVSLIKADLGLSSAVSGLLTTIPMLLFAGAAVFAERILRIFGFFRLTILCLALTVAGILIRSYGGLVGLFGGTALLGAGIGVLNVIVPSFIKLVFPKRFAIPMGAYTASINLFSALASGSAFFLAAVLGDWRNALAVFALLPLFAGVFWTASTNGYKAQNPSKEAQSAGLLRRPSSWCIAGLMGMQAFLYFTFVTWLPSIITAKTGDAGTGSLLMLQMHVFAALSNFVAPAIAQKPRYRGPVAAGMVAFFAAGIAIHLLWGEWVPAAVVAAAVLGLALGAGLSLALTFTAQASGGIESTAKLYAFIHALGYLMAASGPFIVGAIFDAYASWNAALTFLLIFCAPMSVVAYFAGKLTTD